MDRIRIRGGKTLKGEIRISGAKNAALPLMALLGAGGAMALLALIAGRTGGIALFTLAGLMIASLAGTLTSLAISMAPNAFAMSEIVTWLMGALTDRLMEDVLTALPFMLIGALLLLTTGRALDVACGTGGQSVWLARRGLDVVALDASDVAVGLATAAAAAGSLSHQTCPVLRRSSCTYRTPTF